MVSGGLAVSPRGPQWSSHVERLRSGLTREGCPHILTALCAGLAADALARLLRPSAGNAAGFRAFAAAVPLATWSLCLLTIWVRWDVAWSLEMGSGIVVFAALAGLGLSVLVLPPVTRPSRSVRETESPHEETATMDRSVLTERAAGVIS